MSNIWTLSFQPYAVGNVNTFFQVGLSFWLLLVLFTILSIKMKCPRCDSLLPTATLDHCSECGFNSHASCSKHGDHWVRLDRLTDAAHCLRLSERQSLEAQLDDFERRFPQVFFAVYFGVLPQGIKVAEVGFWLLNHAAFGTHDIAKRNEFGIVLVIDPAAGTACFTLGYVMEGLADRIGIKAVLDGIGASLARSQYGEAVKHAIANLDRRLRRAGKAQMVDGRVSVAHTVAPDLGLVPLRSPVRTNGSPRDVLCYSAD